MRQADPFVFTPAPNRADLLYEDRSGSPRLAVYQQDDIRWLGFGGSAVQSVMSVARPDMLLLPYPRVMLTGLMFVQTPLSLLNLGLGGGAFDRFFRHYLPEIAVTSVEVDARIPGIALRWFGLDQGARYVIMPAHEYLACGGETFDLIFCDLHDGDRMPRELAEPDFWRACAARLRAGGAVAINTLAGSETELLGLLRALQTSFRAIALQEIPDHRNIVVFALPDTPPGPDVLATRLEALQARAGITPPPGLVWGSTTAAI